MPSVPSTSKTTADNDGNEIDTWLETFVGKDGVPTNTTKQMIMGGVSGWVTGFLAMKGMKAAATAIGGGIILLQIASHQGYININWTRFRRDMNTAATKIVDGGDQKKKDWTAKITRLAHENKHGAIGFTAGFFLGLASS